MTNRELIALLLNIPMDCEVYVGKGMGPVKTVEPGVWADRIVGVIKP